MDGFWVSAIVVVAATQVISFVLLVGISRELGMILVRIGPSYARNAERGIQPGETVEAFRFEDLNGFGHIVAPGATSKLMLFTSPTCPSCAELLPTLGPMARAHRDEVELLVISSGEKSALDYEHARQLPASVPYGCAIELHGKFGVSLTPYAVLLNPDNVVSSVGIVNNLQMLESLLGVELFEFSGARAKAHDARTSATEVSLK